MSERDLQIAASLFGDVASTGVFDMVALVEDDEFWAGDEERVADDFVVRFLPAEDGMQVLEQKYVGREGFRTGWRSWLEPWDRYVITIEEMIDLGDGRILMMVSSRARLRGTDTEVPQSSASLFVIEGDKIVEVRFYLEQTQARRDLGLD
jgi:ketosteroid isomerase-like protein